MACEHQTRAQYHANLTRLARRAFERHEIIERAEGRWVLVARRADGTLSYNHCAEVAVMRWGHLLVHGDVDTVMFEGYSGEGGAEGLVRWIGRERGDLRYHAAKASRGAGRAGSWCLDDRVACDDLLERVRRAQEEEPGPGRSREIARLRDALRALEFGESVDAVRHALYQSEENCTEWLSSLGEVVDARIYYAVAACQRLVELLDAEKATLAEAGEVRCGR